MRIIVIFLRTGYKGTFEMRSGSHVQLAALRNRDLELQTTLPFSNHIMVQFLSVTFFVGFLQFLLGFSKVPVFLCLPVFNNLIQYICVFLKFHAPNCD